MAKIGLVLNFIGSLFLLISSTMQMNIIKTIISTISDGYGTFGMEKIPNDLVLKFKKQKINFFKFFWIYSFYRWFRIAVVRLIF